MLRPQRPRDPEFLTQLAEIGPDCAAVVAYGGLLPRAALDVPKHGWVNLHFSLLPAWRGAAPVQHAILAGDEVTGACTFQIEEELGLRAGLRRGHRGRAPTDTSGDLLERLAVAGARLLVATLDGIEDGTLVAHPQSSDGVSWAPKLSVADAEVDWSAPAVRVDRLVRACTPAPGAWTTFRGERLKLGPVRARSAGSGLWGQGRLRADRDGVRVGTGARAVLLGEVQPQGKRVMPADDWARGARLGPAERLGR